MGLILYLVTAFTFSADLNHIGWNQLTSKYVKKGVVDYVGFKKEADALESYLQTIRNVTTDEFAALSKNDQKAYLINAYNAYTVKMISDFYPVGSIRDIGAKVGGNIFNKSSKQWRVSEYEVDGKKVELKAMGKSVTLDEIEHENLRPKFEDPRVHFALVCGAVSCPFLRSEAYVGSKIDQQLDDQGKQFLADPFRNRYDSGEKKLYLSKIFDWFKGDFTKQGTLVSFVRKYLPAPVATQVNEETSVGFLTYDWSLNNVAK